MRPFSLARLSIWWCRCCQDRRSRLHLLALDDRLLDDIGLSRQQALKEARKAFWQQTPFNKEPR